MRYCKNCGNKLQKVKEGRVWHCGNCQRHFYANPIPTVDAALFDENGRLLLGVRKQEPNKGRLNLPGGFVDPGENLEEALARELKEELKLTPSDYGNLTYSGSRINRDVFEGEERELLSFIMVADIKYKKFPPNDEVSEYAWKLPSELEPGEVTNISEYEHIQKAAKIYQNGKTS